MLRGIVVALELAINLWWRTGSKIWCQGSMSWIDPVRRSDTRSRRVTCHHLLDLGIWSCVVEHCVWWHWHHVYAVIAGDLSRCSEAGTNCIPYQFPTRKNSYFRSKASTRSLPHCLRLWMISQGWRVFGGRLQICRPRIIHLYVFDDCKCRQFQINTCALHCCARACWHCPLPNVLCP